MLFLCQKFIRALQIIEILYSIKIIIFVGKRRKMRDQATIHSKDDFAGMHKAGQESAKILDYLYDFIRPGITTLDIDNECVRLIKEIGAIAAPLNYKGYPKSVCTSVNHVVCHGIPDTKTVLKNGDIINVDVTVIVDGWYGDSSRMYFVGDNISIQAKTLTRVTYESMMLGIEVAKPGNTTGDIGHAIQQHVERLGFSVVRGYCGHGLGRVFHAAPHINHHGNPGEGEILKPGMFFTIEPMINAGKKETKLHKSDGWTVTTKDYSLSAQFEHAIGITETGNEIFTLSPKGLYMPKVLREDQK